MDPESKVRSILSRRSGKQEASITADTRLVEDLGLDGDDAVDAILEIAHLFEVDISKFDAGKYFTSEPSILSIVKKKNKSTTATFSVNKLYDAVNIGRLEP